MNLRKAIYSIIITITIACFFIFAISQSVPDILRFVADNIQSISNTILIVGLFFSLASVFIRYLNKDIGKDDSKKDNSQVNLFQLKNEVEILRANLEEVNKQTKDGAKNITLSNTERKEFIDSTKKKIAGEMIFKASEDLKREMLSIKDQLSINEHYEDMVYRIKKEIDRLNRRGGANLGIGALIAFAGITYLGFVVINQAVGDDRVGYVLHMLPRISFVIVIEVFAYFFLKLYKNGFDEVKYFQNELTNIESKVLAIKFLKNVKNVKNEELMSEVIKSLMTTERNFVLSKGQTTVALEKEKLKGIEDRNMIAIVKDLIRLKTSGT
ncbi:hypothetical protein [Kosakonia sacchari]|uniref:MotA/TolQ/ExbB proton channel domain-containing protein n=1 Tax=Kosakonia sacchari TaxID=1158459 RepID=A0ABZ0MJU4_9ENTR|nr:hypothetical protein [Kosakonia sacchari]WOZ75650.1 hypothetical protein Q8Y70_13590 [Kosakonia sacchari]